MKRLLLAYLLPATIVGVLILQSPLAEIVHSCFPSTPSFSRQPVIHNFYSVMAGNPFFENRFLYSEKNKRLFILGSSELSSEFIEIPHKFFSYYSDADVVSFGHAGHQSFSMYCQLLAHTEKLPDCPVVFIVSPGWFEGEFASGTSAHVLLEENSPRFFHHINKVDNHFKSYACKRMYELLPDITAPTLEMRLLAQQHQTKRNPVNALFYTPVKWITSLLLNKKTSLQHYSDSVYFSDLIQQAHSVAIPWDSLMTESREKVLQAANNNTLGINNTYYDLYAKHKSGQIQLVPDFANTEWEDFCMLLELIKHYNIRAYFVIQPLNPYYYTNLHELQPMVDSIEHRIARLQYPCLNLFTADTSAYDKAILSDVMHLSTYGWLRINKELNTYYTLSP